MHQRSTTLGCERRHCARDAPHAGRRVGRLRVPVNKHVARRPVPGFRFPQVSIDEHEMARLAAAHLIERGCPLAGLLLCYRSAELRRSRWTNVCHGRASPRSHLAQFRSVAAPAASPRRDRRRTRAVVANAPQAGGHHGLGRRAWPQPSRGVCVGRFPSARGCCDRLRRGR